jgi:hypothetical protein
MKKIIAVCLFSFITGVCLHAQGFSWEIKFLKVAAKESVPISETIEMKTGEKFQITITPYLACYCYVALYDSTKEITVLHDQPLQKHESKYLGPLTLQAPAGTETIYVIMSLEKQGKLEGFIQSFKKSSSARNGRILYKELQNLQAAASKQGNPVPSFIPSAVASRETEPEYATRFSGKNRYVSTIAVSH